MRAVHVVPEVETFCSLGGDGCTDDAGSVIQLSGKRGFDEDVVAGTCKIAFKFVITGFCFGNERNINSTVLQTKRHF